MRNRPDAGWESDEMQAFLKQKLKNQNAQYPLWRKIYIDMKEPFRYWKDRVIHKLKRMMNK